MTPTVLIAEDNDLVAFSIEQEFSDARYAVAGPFSTCTTAMGWLSDHTPAIAILDVILDDGPCLGLARELRSRGVPFIIYSGHDPSTAAPEFQDAPWVTKPTGLHILSRTAERLLASQPPTSAV